MKNLHFWVFWNKKANFQVFFFAKKGQKGPFFNFPKKFENVIPKTRHSTKIANFNEGISKKCKNVHFWAFWAKTANF